MIENPDEPRFLTEREAAVLLGCLVYKVGELRSQGKFPYLPGKPILIERSDLLAFKVAEEAPKSQAQIRADARTRAQRALFKRRLRSGYFNKR